MRSLRLLLILPLLLAGCTPLAPAVTSNVPGSTAPANSQPAATTVATDFSVTELAFAGNGDTFLAHIADVAGALGERASHRFVAVTDSGGLVWQGEELRTDRETIVLLQPRGSGGGIGVELRGPAGAAWQPGLDGIGLTMNEEVLRPDPDIRAVRVRQTGEGLWSFDVTLAYPDTGWEDYADGWHIETPDGAILATRILLHPHETEQPFTRGLGNVRVPAGVDQVIVRAHTLVRGYSAATVAVDLK